VTANNSLNGSARTKHVAEGLTTALDLQKPSVNDLRVQGAQVVLALKISNYFKSRNRALNHKKR
jgi:hypothetical protein